MIVTPVLLRTLGPTGDKNLSTKVAAITSFEPNKKILITGGRYKVHGGDVYKVQLFENFRKMGAYKVQRSNSGCIL